MRLQFIRLRFNVSVNGYHSGELYDVEDTYEARQLVAAEYAVIIPYTTGGTVAE